MVKPKFCRVYNTSLKHHNKLEPTDKHIWDAAYNEEFDSLVSLPSWEIITETQFRQLSKGLKALPTMAIATIKYDEYNHPKCAKYRIVALGNLITTPGQKSQRLLR